MQVTGHLRVKRGIWHMVIRYYDEIGGRHEISESTGLTEKGNKRKAQKMLDERLPRFEEQFTTPLVDMNKLFLDFMRSWLDDVVSFKVRENTMTQYRYVFNSYISKYKPFRGVKVRDLTPALLQSYYNELLKNGLSPNTVRKHHANIHRCLDYAVRLGLIPANPSSLTELPPKRKYRGATAYTPEQLKELLVLFKDDPLETVVELTATYGFRRSEVLGLQWSAIDFDTGTIHVCHTAIQDKGRIIYADSTKTATSNRILPLIPSMRAYLLSVKAKQEENRRLFGSAYHDSDYVCTYPDGSLIRPDFVTQHFQRKLKDAGQPVTRFHDLRHSAVYTLRKGGCDAKDIQAWLGHSDISTTMNIYGHLLGGDMARLGMVMDSMLFPTPKAS